MKNKYTLLLAFFVLQLGAWAQFDDRFYYPQKEWNSIPDSVDYQEFNLKTKDNTLNGILLNAEQVSDKIIFFLHGAGGNVTTYLPMTLPIVKGGVPVFMIDMPGYGKSTGTPTHLGIEKEVVAAFDLMLKEKAFKNKKIIVYGASMGTQAAAVLARDRQEEIELLILEGGMSSFTDIAVASAPEAQKIMIAQFLVSPYSSKEILSSIEGLKKWIIHSEEDSAVPISQAEEVFEKAAMPKCFWKFEGEHLEANQKHADEFMERMNQLLVD